MAQSTMTIVYVLLASAVALLVGAALLWFGVVDLGFDTGPLALVLAVGAVMDIAFSTFLLVRMTRR